MDQLLAAKARLAAAREGERVEWPAAAAAAAAAAAPAAAAAGGGGGGGAAAEVQFTPPFALDKIPAISLEIDTAMALLNLAARLEVEFEEVRYPTPPTPCTAWFWMFCPHL
jgi:hypothetical protein